MTRRTGFTLAETAVVLAIASVIMLTGIPALLTMLQRQKLTGTARQIVQVFQLARMEAIRRSAPGRVVQVFVPHPTRPGPTTNTGSVFAYVDTNGNGAPDDGERVSQDFQLPRGISWQGPGDSGAGHDNGAWNFPGADNADGVATFMPDGTVVFEDPAIDAAFRLTNGPNYLEVRIESPLTAKIVIQKYFGDPAAVDQVKWCEDGEGGCKWHWN
jgi:prepilin-type N-terminal cleavage/methylation domain-containing protein